MITAIILSAGASSRMGEPKALLKCGKKIFIENILDNIKNSGVNDIIAVLGFDAEKIQPLALTLSPEGRGQNNTRVNFVINPHPEEGQFSSLKTGIVNVSAETTAVLIQLVDVPAVKPETYKTVISAHKNNPEKIIIPYYNGRHGAPCARAKRVVHGHPVIFPKKFFKGLLDYPLSKTARDFIHEQPKDNILNIEVNDPGILKDFDTKEDLINK